MTTALALIQTVEANGGQLRVDGEYLVIKPSTAAAPVMNALRQHKGEIIRLLESRQSISPAADHEEWRAPFVEWLNLACAFHPRAFGGVRCLHIAFCEWETTRGGIPCSLDTFQLLLKGMGVLTGELNGTLLVSGLTFKGDIEAHFPNRNCRGLLQ